MIIEYIRYAVAEERAEAFTNAYRRAGLILDADPHCQRWELARGEEEPDHFVVRIEWDSTAGHLDGFRTSPAFARFFVEVRPFYPDIREMKHYRPLSTGVDA